MTNKKTTTPSSSSNSNNSSETRNGTGSKDNSNLKSIFKK